LRIDSGSVSLSISPASQRAAPKSRPARIGCTKSSHDGYRLLVVRDGKRVRLLTRNGHDWTARYPLRNMADT
jgi:hypothetical protein